MKNATLAEGRYRDAIWCGSNRQIIEVATGALIAGQAR